MSEIVIKYTVINICYIIIIIFIYLTAIGFSAGGSRF